MIRFSFSIYWRPGGWVFNCKHWGTRRGIHHWWLDLWIVGVEITLD